MMLLLDRIVSRILNGSIGRTMARMCPDPVTHVDTREPFVALTFDDGPHPVYSPRLLKILDDHGARATFFMVGEAARSHPDIIQLAARSGHALGNHSDTHLNLSQTRSAFVRWKQMRAGKRALASHCINLFRPPFGAYNDQVKLDAWFMGYRIILWNVSAQDWVPQTADAIAAKLIDRLSPGTIFLLHDAMYPGDHVETMIDRDPMLDGLETALDTLKGRLHFVTVPELLKFGRPLCHWPR
jgi:peptidoglycan/xylan/chitin deacetylase (PgdA/CDA1 family)